MRLLPALLLAALACSSSPPPKAKNVSDTAGPPPMSEALRPQMVTTTLAATPATPSQPAVTVRLAGTQVWVVFGFTLPGTATSAGTVGDDSMGTAWAPQQTHTLAAPVSKDSFAFPEPAAGATEKGYVGAKACNSAGCSAMQFNSWSFTAPLAVPPPPTIDSLRVVGMSHWPSAITVAVGQRARPICEYAHMGDGRVRLMETVSTGGTFTPLAAVCDSAGRSLFGAAYAVGPLPPHLRQLRLATR